MTDARMPGRWLTDLRIDRLTDRAFRTFTCSLMFGAEQGTDGLLEARALRYLYPEGVDAATAHELVQAGLWGVEGDGYRVDRWSETQSSAAQVAAGRERKAENSRKYRARQQVRRSAPSTGHVSDDATSDASDTALGKARRGQALPLSPSRGEDRGPTASPVAPASPSSLTCIRHPDGNSDKPCQGCREAREAADKARTAALPASTGPDACRFLARHGVHSMVDGDPFCQGCAYNPDTGDHRDKYGRITHAKESA